MLGVDTNVLVRFLTRDDVVQSGQALRLITGAGNQPIYICLIVLVETVWVLTKVKRLPPEVVFEACRALLANDSFSFEQHELVSRAIDDAARVGCDLADALIALVNSRDGCVSTATFDIRARDLEHMMAVEQRL